MHENLSLEELQQKWAEVWGYEPSVAVGRKMLEVSLEAKLRATTGTKLNGAQKRRLEGLVREYKRNANYFGNGGEKLKPGVKLIRDWKGTKHSVTVTEAGFEYKGANYTSLSKIAFDITGTRWNGWVFFRLKKR